MSSAFFHLLRSIRRFQGKQLCLNRAAGPRLICNKRGGTRSEFFINAGGAWLQRPSQKGGVRDENHSPRHKNRYVCAENRQE